MLNIFQDLKTVSAQLTLADLGMDSLMGAEIKQTLERNFDLVLSAQEIRTLTFGRLSELGNCGSEPVTTSTVIDSNGTATPPAQDSTQIQFDNLPELMPSKVIVQIPSRAVPGTKSAPIFIVHPIEGVVSALHSLAAELPIPIWGLQCTKDAPLTSIPDLAKYYIKHVKEVQPVGPYSVGGYSFGATVAFEMGLQLESLGEQVSLLLLDGSPAYVSSHTVNYKAKHNKHSKQSEEADALTYFISLFKEVDYQKTKAELQALPSWEARLSNSTGILSGTTPYPADQLAAAAESFYNKLSAADKYQPANKVSGEVTLFRAKDNFVKLGNDYGLSKVCKRKVQIHAIDGNHREILRGESMKKIAHILRSSINEL
ncbi:unnamed protein product [Timema podura]|uniref:oleoyl-[acyl-carrier-protein] hydrolase n=1 Tax=Timema podura TaxID=61482 RepID=A0ABN7P746_TIMPD|nr:unnamed protein product [Timema podura]